MLVVYFPLTDSVAYVLMNSAEQISIPKLIVFTAWFAKGPGKLVIVFK